MLSPSLSPGQDAPDEAFELLPNRRGSPFPMRSGATPSISSSTYFDSNISANNSTTTLLPLLPQVPRPTFSRRASSTYSSSSNDQTACPSLQLELDLGDYASYKEKDEGKDRLQNLPLSVTSFDKRLNPDSYVTETLHKHDDIEFLPLWKRRMYRLSPLFTFLAVSAYFLYYAYRIYCTVFAQRAYHKVYIMAWLFIAAEGCVACKFSASLTDPVLIRNRPCTTSPTLPNAFNSRPMQTKAPSVWR
jgi:hypothetical protein